MIGPSRSPGRRSHRCPSSSLPISNCPGGVAARWWTGKESLHSACLSASNIDDGRTVPVTALPRGERCRGPASAAPRTVGLEG